MDKNINKLVSIIVPCFNQGNFLEETLNSVIKQSYNNWECIIVNDGSTDNTEEIAKKYLEKDHRFKYFKQENKGRSESRNFGIKKSNGEYILPLDSDDLIGEEYLNKATKILEEKPKVSIVYCDAKKFGIENKIWKLPKYSLEAILSQNIIFASALFRRSDFDSTNGYDNRLDILEDWDMWLSIIELGGNVYKIPEILFFYRIKENSTMKLATKNEKINAYKIRLEKHSDLYARYWEENESLLSRLPKIKKLFLYKLLLYIKNKKNKNA